MPKINSAGLHLLTQFEGCNLNAYQDVGGVWTIGYGHTGPPAASGVYITQPQAVRLLTSDLAQFEQGVNDALSDSISSDAFSAMVCLAYNIGLGAFTNSSLLKFVNERNYKVAAYEFMRWVYVQGVIVAGLVRRRHAEMMLFERGVGLRTVDGILL